MLVNNYVLLEICLYVFGIKLKWVLVYYVVVKVKIRNLMLEYI